MVSRLFLVGIFLSGIILTSPVQASSWLGWGEKKEPATIPGMAPPMGSSRASGAAPSTAPTAVELDADDMAIMATILKEQTQSLKSLGDVTRAREAEVAAREAVMQEAITQQNAAVQAIALKQAGARLPVAVPKTPVKPVVTGSTKPPAIKPYVAPRVPVGEWQAIVDAEKQKNPPRGNITVISPAPAPAP